MSTKEFKLVLGKFYVFSFLTGCCFFSAVLVPFFTQWGQVSQAVVQGLQSWFTFWVFLLEIPTGVVADRFGRKNSIALGCLISAGAAIVYGSYPNLGAFALGEVLFALGVALISGANRALIYDALLAVGEEDKAGVIFGRSRSIHLAGIIVGAPVGSFIAQHLGLNAPMLLTSAPLFLAFLVAFSISEPKRQTKEKETSFQLAKAGFACFWGKRCLRQMAFNAVAVATAGYFVIWLYQPLMDQLGIPIGFFGWGHIFLVAGQIAIAANFDRLSKFFGSTGNFLCFSALITTAAFLLAAVWPSYVSLLLFLGLAGGFGLTRMELMLAQMNQLIPSKNRATVLSAISMFRTLTLALFNPIVGLTVDSSLRLSFLLVGLLPLMIFFFPIDGEVLDN